MGKLAEIKDMEEAMDNKEANEFLEFTKRQNEHNLLTEKLMKITAGCAVGMLAVVVVSAAVLVPKGVDILSDAQNATAQVQEMLPQAQSALADIQQVASQVKEGDPKGLMENINGLAKEGKTAVDESVQELKKAVDVLEGIDIESLNRAVDNLGKAVSPLAKLFGGR